MNEYVQLVLQAPFRGAGTERVSSKCSAYQGEPVKARSEQTLHLLAKGEISTSEIRSSNLRNLRPVIAPWD
jgi:hypothetical protein